ncbi:MAG: zinc ribbon domain-containing protein [Ruminococcaceae bacterium]|nr:zinc ribbon domain-containing protein [Oscillospiraceae bacterium]
MICTKCNSEVPNGAKFCPVCGNACGTAPDVKPAAASPEAETKTYCGKCGLELNRGAKFCAVCGAPAAAGDVKINENDGSTFGRGDMSAVSLDKPSASDSLVAAMNTAAAPSAVPTPSNNVVPTPSNGVPMPSNSNNSGFSSGFSGSGTGYGSSAPSFIPESPAANSTAAPFGASENPFGDMGAAAIVATPIKKRTGLKVGIIIASVAAVLIAAAAIFFFTNKATALSLIMGKPNYAAMVEGNSIKQAAEKLDTAALSESIKSTSTLAASLASIGGEYEPDFGGIDESFGGFTGVSNTSTHVGAAPMMSYSEGGVDLEAIISSYYQAMMDTYGMNSVKASVSINASISDSVKSMLGEDADEIIELLNGLTFSTDVTASKDTIAAQMGASSGSAVINAKTIFTADGDVYLVLPFVGDKALKVKIPTEKSTATADIKPLELDDKEIERIIGEMVELYVKEYKEGAIEMGDGELTAAGLTAKGKLITAEFSGEKLAALFGTLAEHFVNDEYFTNKIVDFANEYGADITAQEYRDEIMSAFDPDLFDDTDKLVISTVIDNNGNVLAKSWKALEDTDEMAEIVYVDSKEQITFEIRSDSKTVLSVVNDVKSDKEGSVNVKFADDDGVVSVTVDYSGVETAKFCGKDTFVGNYTIGLDIPADFAEGVDMLSGMKFTVSNSVSGDNTMETTIGASVSSYGSVTLKSTVSVSNDNSALTIPTDVIDLGNGEDQPDEATLTALMEYLESVGKKLEEMKDGPFDLIYESVEGMLLGGFGGTPGTTGGEVSFDDVYDLTEDISDTLYDLGGFSYEYGVYDDALDKRADDLWDKLDDLYTKIVNKDWELTKDEFTKYTNEYNALKADVDALEKDYKAAQPADPVTPVNPAGSSAEELNFDNMTDDDLYDVINEYGERFVALYSNYEYMDKMISDESIMKLVTETNDAYDKVVDDYSQFIDSYINGNYSVALLRNTRKSAKAFALAVEALEKALMTQA